MQEQRSSNKSLFTEVICTDICTDICNIDSLLMLIIKHKHIERSAIQRGGGKSERE